MHVNVHHPVLEIEMTSERIMQTLMRYWMHWMAHWASGLVLTVIDLIDWQIYADWLPFCSWSIRWQAIIEGELDDERLRWTSVIDWLYRRWSLRCPQLDRYYVTSNNERHFQLLLSPAYHDICKLILKTFLAKFSLICLKHLAIYKKISKFFY